MAAYNFLGSILVSSKLTLLGSLTEFRKKNAGKKASASKAKDVKKKRKLVDEDSSHKNENDESKQDDKNEDIEEENETGNDWDEWFVFPL